jgi:hypothetical protein
MQTNNLNTAKVPGSLRRALEKMPTRRWGEDREEQLADLADFNPREEGGTPFADQRRIYAALAAQDPSRLTRADMAVLTSVPTPLRKIPQLVTYLTTQGMYATAPV